MSGGVIALIVFIILIVIGLVLFFVFRKKGTDGGDSSKNSEKATGRKDQIGPDGVVLNVDCVGDWGEWSNCSADCGGGERSRTYTITTPASGSGASCPNLSDDVQTEACNINECNADCIGDWSEWSNCSVLCGGGIQTKTYKVTLPANGTGQACEAEDGNVLERTCNTDACPVDCVGSWEQEFGNCVSSGTTSEGTLCGNGIQTRKFHVIQEAQNGGKSCTDASGNIIGHLYQEEEPCPNLKPCPVDCEGAWGSNYSACQCTDPSKPGIGNKFITYSVSKQAAHGGKACEAADGTKSFADCNCPVDCVGTWNNPSCTHAKQGEKNFTYKISQPALYGGKACPHANNAKKTEFCNNEHERQQAVGNHDRNVGNTDGYLIRGPKGVAGALEVRATWKRGYPATWTNQDNGVNVYVNDVHRIQWKRRETSTGSRKSSGPAIAWISAKSGDRIKAIENGKYTSDGSIYWRFHPGSTAGTSAMVWAGGQS